jgi:hypothetical protein
LGWAYCINAVENPALYRAMFFETTANMEDASFGALTFLPVVGAVERALEKGRLTSSDAWGPAVEMWALAHGTVSLALGGMLTSEDLLYHLQSGIRACLIGFGDLPKAADRSLRAAHRRMLPAAGLPSLPARGATLAAATLAAGAS